MNYENKEHYFKIKTLGYEAWMNCNNYLILLQEVSPKFLSPHNQ